MIEQLLAKPVLNYYFDIKLRSAFTYTAVQSPTAVQVKNIRLLVAVKTPMGA